MLCSLALSVVTVQGLDISYNAADCDVIYNERLSTDSSELSRLLIDCDDFELESDFAVNRSMSSSVTDYVDHFSATLITLYPNSTSYYPGYSETFDYVVTDRLGTVVEAKVTSTYMKLSHESFSSYLSIDKYGDCQNCEDGVLLSEISISSDFGTNYTLDVLANTDSFIMSTETITFNITGCPVGYGADSNNNTCTVCDTFTYNIEDNFVRNCLSCDPDDNDG